MLFQELVEQHRVHRFVAHGLGFSFFIAHDQVGIHFFNLLGNQAKLRDPLGIELFFVTEGDGFECEERFTGLVHRLDGLLEPRG